MAFDRMINGFRVFRANYIGGNSSVMFDKLVHEGQNPETLVIACSDSRIDPALVTNSQPGDIFSVRNIAAMVPEFNEDGDSHGTSAAIEYAVSALKVKYIVVMGHAYCGGIKALLESGEDLKDKTDMISRWIGISVNARDAVRQYFPKMAARDQTTMLEQASLLVSMQNLMTFPSIARAVAAGELQIHGWYFDLPKGRLLNYDPTVKKFRNVLAGHTTPAICTETCGCQPSLLALDGFLQAAQDDKTVLEEKASRRKAPRDLKTALRKVGYGAAVTGGAENT